MDWVIIFKVFLIIFDFIVKVYFKFILSMEKGSKGLELIELEYLVLLVILYLLLN